ncbi:MAG: S1 RNA-binding domain-containing protein, partial [Clostridia bacterium]|nr:S1 RNA-binding domain-containing protein [Clostridia bacterium]
EDTGDIFISAINAECAYAAKAIIDGIVFEPVPGEIYEGKVTRIIPIGAFVEIAPNKEGLVHISKLENRRVEKVEDVCEVGDTMRVKFLGSDEKGRLNLSRKDAL